MQHLRLASPELSDPASGEPRIGQQHIDAGRTELIPLPQGMQLPTNQRTESTSRQRGSLQIGMHLIPGVAHRRMDIADVQLLR